MDIVLKTKRNSDLYCSVKLVDEKAPLVMYVHGFKGDRHEDNRFDAIAQTKNYYGISMDFPSCGDSKEDFLNYSLRNCLDDMEIAYKYMLDNYDVDHNKIYLVGYSMGGRLISLFSSSHPEVNKMVFWAAACFEGFEDGKFLANDALALKKEADELGYCNFCDVYLKVYDKMSKDFIDDMLMLSPTKCLQQYCGEALIIQGDKDITVRPSNAQLIYDNLINCKKKEIYTIEGADHGFGIWDSRLQDSEELVKTTIAFL